MEEKYTFKDRIVDFWDEHKEYITLGVIYVGCFVMGYKVTRGVYNLGYKNGVNGTMMCCEKYLPEAKVTSTLTQIAMNQTEK